MNSTRPRGMYTIFYSTLLEQMTSVLYIIQWWCSKLPIDNQAGLQALNCSTTAGCTGMCRAAERLARCKKLEFCSRDLMVLEKFNQVGFRVQSVFTLKCAFKFAAHC